MLTMLCVLTAVLLYKLLMGIRPALGRRTSALLTAAGLGTFAVVSAEALTLPRLLTPTTLISAWTLLGIACAVSIWKHRTPTTPGDRPTTPPPSLNPTDILLISVALLFLAAIALTALVSPPNNWDSMTTHMTRVMHWLQDRGLMNYPTSMLKQLNYPPGSSILILHLAALSGSDIFANLIQWLMLALSIIGLTLIAQQMGASPRTQLITTLIALSTPLAILEGASTQNDMVVTGWLITFIALSLRHLAAPSLLLASGAGLALGLAAHIKGTGYIFAIPFLLWILWRHFHTDRCCAWRYLACIVVGFTLINTPYLLRNMSLTGTLIPPSETSNMAMPRHDPRAIAANLLENSASQLSSTNMIWNRRVSDMVNSALPLLGVDPEHSVINNAETVFGLNSLPFHEDNSASPWHLILIYLSLLLLLAPSIRQASPRLAPYALALLAGFLLFNTLVKWTPYNNRYHLPFLLLGAPLITLILARISRRLALAAALLSCAAALPWLLASTHRPLLGHDSVLVTDRYAQYFSNRPKLLYSHHETIRQIAAQGCSDIGLAFGEDDWEYSFWMMARRHISPRARLEHVLTANASSRLSYPAGAFTPCAVIATTDRGGDVTVNGATLSAVLRLPGIFLYLPHESHPLPGTAARAALMTTLDDIDLDTREMLAGPPEALFRNIVERLRTIQNIDIGYVRQRAPEMVEPMSKGYVNGLLMALEGIRTADPRRIQQGIILTKYWQVWIRKNQAVVKRAFELL